MGELLTTTSAFYEMDPISAFQLFGRFDDAGWIMSARLGRTMPGAVAELAVPLPSGAGSVDLLRGTGRILEAVPWRRIVLAHESPWSGISTITFTPERGGTTVRVTSEITSEAIGYINQHLGSPTPVPDDDAVVIGLMSSLSGDAGIFGRAILNCAHLAAQEVNADGGVLGRPVRIMQMDDANDPVVAGRSLDRMMQTPSIAAVIGSHTSNTLNALTSRILSQRILYLYAPVNEGHARVGNLFRLGESSRDQLRFAIPELSRRTGGRRWFLLGNDYSWPREIGRVARRAIGDVGGRVVGERYLPFRRASFDEVLDELVSSRADVLLSSMMGFDSVDFERAFVAAGLRSKIVTLSALLEDSTLDHLGSAADGIWSSLSFFGGEGANAAFVARYRAAWGLHSSPPSAVSVSVYDTVHLWAKAARTAGSVHPDAVAAALPGTEFTGSRGPLRIGQDGTMVTEMFLAQVRGGAFSIADSFATRPAI